MQWESTYKTDLHFITCPFTFPYPHTTCIVLYSNPALIYTVTNPDLYIGGAVIHTCAYIHVHTYMFYLSGHPDPEIRWGWGGGGDLKNNFFGPFRPQSGPKLRGSPRPLPWIHHCYNNPSTHFIFLPLQI